MEAKNPSRTFHDVVAWQKAHAWVLAVYRFTDEWPRYELYGLTSQLRRAAASVPLPYFTYFPTSTTPSSIARIHS